LDYFLGSSVDVGGGTTSQLAYSNLLGRKIRSGSAEALSMSTAELAVDALRKGDAAGAREYLDYLLVEVGTMLEYLSGWLASTIEIARTEIGSYEADMARLEAAIGVAPPTSATGSNVGSAEADDARSRIENADRTGFELAVQRLVDHQIAVLDAQTDWSWGLLTILRDAVGESRLGQILCDAQSHVVDRYQGFDMPIEELVALTVEGMRALHTGPDRNGRVEVVEEPDRWTMTFDPCGSGGRMRRGDPRRGQLPRTEAPFNFGMTHEPHDWSWNEANVCLYCAHCAVAGELMPIERNGHPMRVTEHPTGNAEDVCRFIIYKSPELIPASAYTRVGKKPPPDAP
jgi:hypothetical protein